MPRSAVNSTQTVLIADDDSNDVLFLKRALKNCGLEPVIDSAVDGERAIEYLTNKPHPELVFLDLKMPGVDGLEVLKWIRTRKELESMPVIVLSSSPLEEDRRKALDLGAREYRVKPQDFDELKRIVLEICNHWLHGVR